MEKQHPRFCLIINLLLLLVVLEAFKELIQKIKNMNTHKSTRSGLIAIFVLASTFMAYSQKPAASFSQQEIDAFIEKNMKELHIPAVSYAVMQNGEYISSGVYGLAEVELNAPANEHTLFNVGSVGKTFTATAIMVLEEDGKLSIKDPIGKHLEGIPDSWNNITIEHLLNHTSGIKDYVQEFPYPILPNIDRAVELTPEQYIEMCTSNPLNFPTGERFAYSNSNYALLGFIIRKHIETSMDEFMRKRIFEPAGMMDTRYEAAFELRPNRAKGYHKGENGPVNGALISEFYSTIGDCGILTTGKDLAKWGPALMSGKIVSKAQLNKMWTTHILNDGGRTLEDIDGYGLGWYVNDVMGSPEHGHGGSFMKGYTAYYRYYPDFDLSIAVMSNRWVARDAISTFYELLATHFLPSALKFTSYQAIDGALAEQWIERFKTFGKILAEKGDLTPITDKAYIKALDQADWILNNAGFGSMLLARKIEFLQENDLSDKQVFKHGKKAQRVALFTVMNPDLLDNPFIVYYTMHLSEEGKILGTNFRTFLKE